MKPKELAERVGVHKSTISRYISGKRRVPEKAQRSICEALELSPGAWQAIENTASRLGLAHNEFLPRSGPYPPHDDRDLIQEPGPDLELPAVEIDHERIEWIGESLKDVLRELVKLFAKRTR